MGTFESVEEGQEAIRLKTWAEPAYRSLATAYIGLDRLREAKDCRSWARFLKAGLSPASSRKLLSVGYARQRRAPSPVRGTQRTSSCARTTKSHNPLVLSSLGYLYARLGRADEARTIIDKLQQRAGPPPTIELATVFRRPRRF